MRVPRRHRRWLSGWLVALLLTVQWATAAYACPRLAAAPDAVEAAAAMAAMPDCAGGMTGMDPDQPHLCKAHCDAGKQSVNSGGAPVDAPAALALAGPLAGLIDLAAVARLASAMPPSRAAGPPRGTPPLFLSLLVLRR